MEVLGSLRPIGSIKWPGSFPRAPLSFKEIGAAGTARPRDPMRGVFMEGRVGFDRAITLLFIGQKSATFAANRVEEFYMATNYFFKVFLGDLDNQGNARKQWIGFDTTFIVAGSDVKVQDHDVESEQDGRNELVRITTFKRFAAVVNDSADIHTIHTLFLLEQTKAAVATDIEFYKWDDKVKPDKQGNASVISLA